MARRVSSSASAYSFWKNVSIEACVLSSSCLAGATPEGDAAEEGSSLKVSHLERVGLVRGAEEAGMLEMGVMVEGPSNAR